MKSIILVTLAVLGFAAIAQIPGGILVGGFIAPPATNSTYGVTQTRYGVGGLLTGATGLSQLQDLNWYPMARRQAGMMAVLSDGTQYRLDPDLTTWVNVNPVLASNGSGTNLLLAGDTFANSIRNLPAIDSLAPGTAYNAFGDSITRGANAAVTNYTDGAGSILEQFRWPYLIATSGSRAFAYTNNGLGGTSHAFISQADQIGRRTPFNRFGTVMPFGWTGLVTMMIGYNDLAYMASVSTYDQRFQNAQEAFIARCFIDNYAGVGTAGADSSGTPWPSWTTTGTQFDDPYTDCVPFMYGNPGVDQRRRVELTGSQMAELTLTDVSAVGVFFDTFQNGGTFFVYTNGVSAGTVNTQFTYSGGFGQSQFPGVLWMTNLPNPVTISITNNSGTNRFLAIGWVNSSGSLSSQKTVILGSITKSPVEGAPFSKEQRIGAATLRAVASFPDFNVFYANVFDRMVTDSDNQWNDLAHLTPIGNAHVREAFEQATKVFPIAQADAAVWRMAADKADRVGTSLNQINQVTTTRLWVGTNSTDNRMIVYAPAGSAAAVALGNAATDTSRRWEFRKTSAAETGSDAGSLLQLVKFNDAGSANGVVWQGYRDSGTSWFAFGVTNLGKITASADIRVNSATPLVNLDSTSAPKRFVFQTNSVDNIRIESDASGTYARVVMTDINGSAANVPQYWHRGGGATFSNQVTNQSFLYQEGILQVGSASSTGAQVYLDADDNDGDAQRLGWRQGNTNRVFVEMIGYDRWRVNGRDNTGAAAWNLIDANIQGQHQTIGGNFWTNTAEAHFNANLTTHAEIRANSTTANTGFVYFQNSGVNLWRIGSTTTNFNLGRYVGGVLTDSPITVRGDGKIILGPNGTPFSQKRQGTATLVAGTVTISDGTVTANTIVTAFHQSFSGTQGWLGCSARTPGVSFTITSSSATDTSVIAYELTEP